MRGEAGVPRSWEHGARNLGMHPQLPSPLASTHYI